MNPLKSSKSKNPAAEIDYQLFLDCVHCGLCTASCPTYVELGDENDSPRGRIHLMRAVADERIEPTTEVVKHLDLCLNCRACETACPSGVQYGKLIEPFRDALKMQAKETREQENWYFRKLVLQTLPYPQKMRQALKPVHWLKQVGLFWILKSNWLTSLLPAPLDRMTRMLPDLPSQEEPLPEFLPAQGKRRATVALFTGCVSSVMFGETNWATARVLQENGCDVIVPQQQSCCGAIHQHAGDPSTANDFADKNSRIFNLEKVDAIISNVAGCGAMLKEYAHLWSEDQAYDDCSRRKKFAGKVKDIHEFLEQLGLIPPAGKISLSATYHDACHLAHAQKIREAPRRILSTIPGLQLVPLAESDLCCGAAGTYNLTQPEMSDRLSKRKRDNILKTKSQVVISANAGCTLQIQQELATSAERVLVLHPIQLLDASYQNQNPLESR